MKMHLFLLLTILCGCQGNSNTNKRVELVPETDKGMSQKAIKFNSKLEKYAFDGLSIDFKFKNDKPTFGDLFLICGDSNPNRPANSKEFEKLSGLGFEQVDDYFGIKNQTNVGDDVLLWLFPIIDNKEVYHSQGPFEAIRITYVVIRNEKKTIKLFEEVYNAFKKNLNVDTYFDEVKIDDFSIVKEKYEETIEYCEKEYNVSPGSMEAMELEW